MIRKSCMDSYWGYKPVNGLKFCGDFLYLYAKDECGDLYFVGGMDYTPATKKIEWIWKKTDTIWKKRDTIVKIEDLLTRLDTSKNYTFHKMEDTQMWSEIIFEERYKYTKLGREIL